MSCVHTTAPQIYRESATKLHCNFVRLGPPNTEMKTNGWDSLVLWLGLSVMEPEFHEKQ
jgi:hypothetical protein